MKYVLNEKKPAVLLFIYNLIKTCQTTASLKHQDENELGWYLNSN